MLSIPTDHELFQAYVKTNFPSAGSMEPGNETMPHNFSDFKFKDYCPEIFMQLREW